MWVKPKDVAELKVLVMNAHSFPPSTHYSCKIVLYDGRQVKRQFLSKHEVYSLFEALDFVKVSGLRRDHFSTYVAEAKPAKIILTELFRNIVLLNSPER